MELRHEKCLTHGHLPKNAKVYATKVEFYLFRSEVKSMIKKVAVIIALLMIASLSMAGCITNNNKQASVIPGSQTTTTTADVTQTATVSPSPVPTVTPSVTPSVTPTPTPTPITLSIVGPSTTTIGGGGVWNLYINGQLPTETQATQINWVMVGYKSVHGGPADNQLGGAGAPGCFKIDANGAANLSPGSYPLVATYQGVSTSTTITRLPNPTLTPTAPPDGPFYGSINSDVYHYPSCGYVKNIHPENLISFPSSAAAKAAGYRPCAVCKPP